MPLHNHLQKPSSLVQLQPALPDKDHSAASFPLSPPSSYPSSSSGDLAASSNDTRSALQPAFTFTLSCWDESSADASSTSSGLDWHVISAVNRRYHAILCVMMGRTRCVSEYWVLFSELHGVGFKLCIADDVVPCFSWNVQSRPDNVNILKWVSAVWERNSHTLTMSKRLTRRTHHHSQWQGGRHSTKHQASVSFNLPISICFQSCFLVLVLMIPQPSFFFLHF